MRGKRKWAKQVVSKTTDDADEEEKAAVPDKNTPELVSDIAADTDTESEDQPTVTTPRESGQVCPPVLYRKRVDRTVFINWGAGEMRGS